MPAELIVSAARPEQFPEERFREFAFLGRSNVGKSSLLNCLLNEKRLARTSGTPGCTQVINFYAVGGKMSFVDLPGYGYAKVPRGEKAHWKLLAEAYLRRRSTLELCFLLLDARRGWMESDLALRDWLEHHQRRYMVIATKIDKLNRKLQERGLAAIRQQLPDSAPVPFSAVTGQGAREIWQAIHRT
jgi:GTP-binding protein